MAENENDEERMRRWFREAQERGGPMFHTGAYVGRVYQMYGEQPTTPRAPSKDLVEDRSILAASGETRRQCCAA